MKNKSIGKQAVGGVVVGIFLSCCIMLILSGFFVSKTLRGTIDDEILDLTKEFAQVVDDKLIAEQRLIETMAANPIFIKFGFPFEQKVKYAQDAVKRLGYKNFYIVDVTGKGKNLSPDAKEFDVSEREYFKQSMAGKTYISDILTDKLSGESILIFSTPIYNENRISGILCGIKKIDFISDICSGFSWKKSGIIAIYDRTTQVVGHTNSQIVEEKLNILEKEKQDTDYKEVGEFFREKILKEKTGIGEYYFLGNRKIAGFYNMSVKNWTILMSINKEEIMQVQRNLITFLIISALFVIVVMSLLLYFLLARRLSISLIRTKENIEQLARLEIGRDLPYDFSDRKNELGDIYRAIQSLRQNITGLVQQIRSSIDKLMSSSKDFSQSCNSASAMAADITRTVDEIAQGATAQASDVQDGVAELSHMGVQMESNTVQMKEMIGASDRVDLLQVEGKSQLQSLIDSTKQNTEISVKIQEAIKNTEQSVDEINLAGDTIKSISDQINLLALNAAIEAARAGESGRGFAVVAEEIRKLAESSNLSTEQIRKSVVTLAERTQYAVSQIIESNRVVEEQSVNVAGMSEKFEGISDALEHLRNTIEKIFAANEKINEAREKVSGSMSNIAALTEENAASTEEISASMQEQNDTFLMIATESEALLELGEDLERISSEFKL